MNLIVHIGTEKTGTSSIQDALFENKAQLLKAGFYFSQCAGNRNNMQFPLSCMQYDREDEDCYFTNNGITTSQQRAQYYKDLKQKFADEVNALKNIHTVIISSEHFHSLLVDVQEVKTFRALLGNMFSSIKIVCYLREQVATCVSHYSTRLKTGDSDELSTFIKRCNPQNPYYNYLDLLDRWSHVFGKDNLVVGLFDKKTLKSNDIIDDFFDKIGIDVLQLGFICPQQKNLSLNYIGQCLLKVINSDKFIKKPLSPVIMQFIHNEYAGKGENINGVIYSNLFEAFQAINSDIAFKYFDKKKPLFSLSVPKSDNKIDDVDLVVNSLIPLLRWLFASTVNDAYADTCRDTAVDLEITSIDKAIKLMALAHLIRPEGPFIKRKLAEYLLLERR